MLEVTTIRCCLFCFSLLLVVVDASVFVFRCLLMFTSCMQGLPCEENNKKNHFQRIGVFVL